jgi:CreA protein
LLSRWPSPACLGEGHAAGNGTSPGGPFRDVLASSACVRGRRAYVLAVGVSESPGAFEKSAGAEPNPMKSRFLLTFLLLACASALAAPALADSDDPDLIFRKSTTFKLLTPNDKLATYGVDDPIIDGVACWFTSPEKGGIAGALGLAEQTSDVSLSCRQYAPVKIKDKFEQGDVVFRQRRSLFFKKMQIVRGCDAKRNVLIYMVYTDKLVDGSPKNSTASVPIEPWGGTADVPKCGDFLR